MHLALKSDIWWQQFYDEARAGFSSDVNNSAIRYKKIMYFPDRGCVRTLRTLYVYATATPYHLLISAGNESSCAVTLVEPYAPLQLTFCLSHDLTYHLAPAPFVRLLRLSGTVSYLMSAHVLLSQHFVNI